MIWIFGDSFSADPRGWPGLIQSKTLGLRGSSEYRIYRNYLEQRHNILETDVVIFCHTHQSRVFLKDSDRTLSSRRLESHPWCDLLFNDVFTKNERKFINVLEQIWDDDYFEYMYSKVVSDCQSVKNSIHITFFSDMAAKYNFVDFGDFFRSYRGKINHLTDQGNLEIYKELQKIIHGDMLHVF